MELEPVPYNINGLAKTHIGLDEHLDNLIDNYQDSAQYKKLCSF